MTSPLMALRFSGRLMVIQNACPRFSSMTLLLSVMALLACWSYPMASWFETRGMAALLTTERKMLGFRQAARPI
jgi:hypothetical protein